MCVSGRERERNSERERERERGCTIWALRKHVGALLHVKDGMVPLSLSPTLAAPAPPPSRVPSTPPFLPQSSAPPTRTSSFMQSYASGFGVYNLSLAEDVGPLLHVEDGVVALFCQPREQRLLLESRLQGAQPSVSNTPQTVSNTPLSVFKTPPPVPNT